MFEQLVTVLSIAFGGLTGWFTADVVPRYKLHPFVKCLIVVFAFALLIFLSAVLKKGVA